MAKITMEQVEKINAKMGNGFKLDIETFLSYKEKVAVKLIDISEKEYLKATIWYMNRYNWETDETNLKIELNVSLYTKHRYHMDLTSGEGLKIELISGCKKKIFSAIQKKTHEITDEFIITKAMEYYDQLSNPYAYGYGRNAIKDSDTETATKNVTLNSIDDVVCNDKMVENSAEKLQAIQQLEEKSADKSTNVAINSNITQNTKIDDEIKKLNNKAFCGFKLHEDHYKKHGVKEFAKKIIVGEYALVFTIFLFTINEYKTRVCMDVSLFINELCNEPWSFLANKNYVVLEDGLKKASVRSLHKWTKILTDEYLLNLFNKENAFSYIREMMSIENNANETQLFSKNDELNNNNYEDITDQSTEISDDNEALESLYCGNLFDNYNHKETQSENLANDIFALEPCTKETNQSNPESKKDIIVMTKTAKAKQDVNKSAIMTRAWAIYHTLENGDRRTKLSIAMRQAWSEYKSGNFAMSESTGKKAA